MNDAKVASSWAAGADVAFDAHAAFFWRVALSVLRDELEGRPPGQLALRQARA